MRVAWQQARDMPDAVVNMTRPSRNVRPGSDQVGKSTTGDEKSAERKRVPVMIDCRLLAEDPKDDLIMELGGHDCHVESQNELCHAGHGQGQAESGRVSGKVLYGGNRPRSV